MEVSLAAFYSAIMAKRGFSLPKHFVPIITALEDERIQKLIIIAGPATGKALEINTKVLTKNGWKKIKNVGLDEELITPSSSAKVIVKTYNSKSQLYKIHFSNDRSIICNKEHLWKVKIKDSKKWYIWTTETIKNYLGDYIRIFLPSFNGEEEPEILKITEDKIDESICITLNDKKGLFIIEGNLITHNSELLDTIYPAWLLGKHPEKSILAISAGETLVTKFLKSTIDIIENSPYFKMAFPTVKLNKSLGYSPERGYYTNGKVAGDSNPSYIATGLDSRLLTGLHANVLIWDDLHDKESEFSRDACEKVVSTVYSTLLHRDVPEGSRYICIGRRWSLFDVYGHLQDTGNWVVMTLPVERGDGVSNLWWDVLIPENLSCCFTEGGAEPQERLKYHIDKKLIPYKVYFGSDPEKKGFYWPDYPKIRERCADIKRGSPDHFQSVFQCNPGAREGSVFLEKDFRYFSHPVPIMTLQTMPEPLRGGRIIQSWDTSQKKKEDSDYSVCITAVALPCNRWHRGENLETSGESDPHFDIYILDVFRKKLDINELLTAIRTLYRTWNPSRVIMEDKASGIQALQALQNSGIPLLGLSSENKSKRARATESLGAGAWSAQGWMQQGRVILWEEAPWLETFKSEMKDFIGDGSGLDDIVDSCTYLIRYVISMGGSTPMLPTNFDTDIISKPSLSELALRDPRAEGLARIEVIFAQQEYSDMPQICSTCAMHQKDGTCQIYGRKTAGIDSCNLHRFDEKYIKKRY